MKPSTFQKFRAIVYDKSGISLGPGKEALVSARVGKRMRALGFDEHDEYLEYLLNDTTGDEIIRFIDAISTNVTSFYREPAHFDFLRDVIGKWADQGQTRFRIWCAASSTGEEPYTIAITLAEVLGNRRTDTRILATDISTRVLEHCIRGVYDADKLRTVPIDLRTRYFTKLPGENGAMYEASERLKSMILFRRLNLSTPPFPMKGPMDVVLCRNVMIYFDNAVRKALLDEVARMLRPGGYLIVGHAESLTGMISSLKSVRPSIYVKPG